ncbi:unnamed protein product [Blepharisma stoltei]|uniref:Uncharacterized protein n=1 Tax=Blepharisma stoltei TaxID=1481888 RepID=A0AAU9IDD9_9CILI|nr:unnamed protein product [Blepharisma stoltei]
MACYIENCSSFPLLICSCSTKGTLICDDHFESHLSEINKYPHIANSIFDSSILESREKLKENNKSTINKSLENFPETKLSLINPELNKIDKEIQSCLIKLRSNLSSKLIKKRNLVNITLNDFSKSKNQYCIKCSQSECKCHFIHYVKNHEKTCKFTIRNFDEKLAYLISQDISKWKNIEIFKGSYFNKIDIKTYPEICDILKNILSKKLQDGLFNLILLSKESSEVSQGSSNAITILNRLDYPLSHRDLRGINIPGADLSSSLIIGTNFKGSNLTNVNFGKANLYSVNFDDCYLAGAEFGESCLSPIKTAGTIVNFSPCGKYIVLCKKNQTEIFICDISSQEIVKIYPTDQRVYHCEYSPCGNYLAIVHQDKVILCNAKVHQYKAILCNAEIFDSVVHTCDEISEIICSFAFSLCSKWLAVGLYNHDIKIWDINTKTQVRYLCGHDSPAISLAFTKNYLISTSDWGLILIWNINLPEKITVIDKLGVLRTVKNKQLVKSRYELTWIVLSQNEKYIYASSKQKLFMWNVEKLEEKTQFSDLTSVFYDWALSPCEKFIAVSNKKGLVQIFDIESQVFTFQILMKPWSSPKIAFSPNDDRLAIAGINEFARSWKYKNPSFKNPEITNRKYDFMVLWAPNEDQFALISREAAVGLIEIWSCKTKKVVREIKWYFGLEVNPIFAFSPHGNHFVLSSYCGLHLHRSTVEYVRDYPLRVSTFVISREGLIALGFIDGHIEIAELYSNKLICKINSSTSKNAHCEDIKLLAFSCDSKRLASASSSGGFIRFWNVKTGDFIAQIQIKPKKLSSLPLASINFAPYQNYLAFTANPCNWVTVCHVNSPEEAIRLYGLSTLSYSQVKFSPCGSLLAAINLNFTIDLWNFEKRMLVYTLKGHLGVINSFDFSLCGKKIISGSEDMTIKCWNIRHLYDDSKEENLICLEWSLKKHELVASGISLSRAVISEKNRELLDFLSKKDIKQSKNYLI